MQHHTPGGGFGRAGKRLNPASGAARETVAAIHIPASISPG
ncbi:MAG: hypothetical protein ACK443_10365 [Methylococcaceae bacterium]